MGAITWGTYKPRTRSNARKFTLDKGEQARICFLEPAPVRVFVHNFERVQVNDAGQPIEVTDTWPDGSPRTRVKTEYDGKFRCLGDEEVLDKYGVDAENCPACRASVESPNAVQPPRPRFLGHVLKYSTKTGSFNLAKPFSATLLVWDLTETRFAQLNEIYSEHGSLANKDLLAGPCTAKNFQKYDIQTGSGEAAWTATDETKEFVKELLAEEKVEDLAEVAGKLPSPFELESKVKEIQRAYNHAFNIGNGGSSYESLLGDPNLTNSDEEDEEPKKITVSKAKPQPASEPEVEEEDTEVFSADEDDDASDQTASLDDLLKAFGN